MSEKHPDPTRDLIMTGAGGKKTPVLCEAALAQMFPQIVPFGQIILPPCCSCQETPTQIYSVKTRFASKTINFNLVDVQ